MNCAICGKPMTLINAGVSKRTGKPYDAFYSCKACNTTAPAQTPPKNADKPQSAGVEKILQAIQDSNEEIILAFEKAMDFRAKMFDKLDEILNSFPNNNAIGK